MNDRLKKRYIGIKILFYAVLAASLFFMLVFFSEALSPELFLKRPQIGGYNLTPFHSKTTTSPCTDKEILLTVYPYGENNHITMRGELRAYLPFYVTWIFNAQPFSLENIPTEDIPGPIPNGPPVKAARACISLPRLAAYYAPTELRWALLLDDVVEQNIAPVGPARVQRQTVKKLPFLKNPYSGTLLTFAFFSLGFTFFTYRVFRNPNPKVPPTRKLFLFPASIAFFLSLIRLFSLYSPYSLSDTLPLTIPYPLWFTYPFILVCYTLRIIAPVTVIWPNDFWSRTFFFFFAEGFLSWAFLLSLYGLACWVHRF